MREKRLSRSRSRKTERLSYHAFQLSSIERRCSADSPGSTRSAMSRSLSGAATPRAHEFTSTTASTSERIENSTTASAA